MSIGSNIKIEREGKNMTQKDLADRLYVTPQAVSRWENNLVEPSIDALKQMAAIFGVNLESLTSDEPIPAPEPAPMPQPVSNEAEAEKLVGICTRCGKAVYSTSKFGYGRKHSYATGRGHHHQHVDYAYDPNTRAGDDLFCEDCCHLLEEGAKQAELNHQQDLSDRNKKAIGWGIFAGALSGLIMLMVGILLLVNHNWTGGGWTVGLTPVVAYACFAAIYCLIKRNTWAGEIFMSITEFGFVKMPGVIFSFSADGFVGFFIIKVILGILGFLILFGFLALAFFFTMVFSMFAFPYSCNHEAKED